MVIEPEVAVELSIFWLSVEEEVLPSAPNPGGEVYLKMKKNPCKGQETEVGTLLEMAVELSFFCYVLKKGELSVLVEFSLLSD